jgi:hypothetical protein
VLPGPAAQPVELKTRLAHRPRTACVPRVRSASRLNQQDVRLVIRPGAVLNAARHDVHVPLTQLDVAIAELDGQAPLEDEEELVGLVVLVPDELSLDLDDLDVVVVQLADDLGAPVLGEQRELLREVDLLSLA